MAGGFWAVPMNQNVQHIPAFVIPLGHFQWNSMPFEFKNVPLKLDYCRWGFMHLPPEAKVTVDAEILYFVRTKSERQECSPLSEDLTVFRRNIAAPANSGLYWDTALFRKASLAKELSPIFHLKLVPKGSELSLISLKKVKHLPFSTTLKVVNSSLGSLNDYNKFIEYLSVVVTVLHELTDEQIRASKILEPAKDTYEILKQKIVSTALLRHSDRGRPFVIILHTNP
ncbi:hypothetical protein PHMEG_0008050 [Phytophthora megakarya]|uniref:Reverse transcriptase n=1 Tax=Phytophthora megakarya TaxID=4795 RepID=A0A225WM47_9STRA|nr:hypothetical protein PHMEG_0008050 [Phytophthora megakarya]